MKTTILAVLGLISIALAQNCSTYQICSQCTAHPECGWCGPTATCFEGSQHGPSGAAKCHGPAWIYGPGNCPDCASFTSCKECQYFADDCAWCASGKCAEWGVGTIGCNPVDHCPCDIYGTCSDCVVERGCEWCGSNKTCVPADSPDCPMKAHTCPCSDNADCRSCIEDQNQGCVWCTEGMSGTCKTSTEGAGCMKAMNCNTFCKNLGTTCDSCNVLPGCAWCTSDNTCVDPQSTTCGFIRHTCPNCAAHRYCDTCQDEGCLWCSNGECKQPGDTANCLIQHTCSGFCGAFTDCGACNQAPGCGWCDESAQCVDADESSCFLTHSCSQPQKSGFSGGAFVGGMFLGIFLCGAAVGGFLFYKFKIAKKPGYSELH